MKKNKVNAINYAYLNDGISTFQNKAQKYGTQFDWDENGNLNSKPFDDLDKVNKRPRNKLDLHCLKKQPEIKRIEAKSDGQKLSTDIEKHNLENENWKNSRLD